MNLYKKVLEYSEKKIPVMMVTVISKVGQSPVEVGKKMLIAKNGDAYGTVGGGALEYFARESCRQFLDEGTSKVIKYILNEGQVIENATTLPMVCGGVVEMFFEYIGEKAYVIIFGGGHCGQALLKVLKTMDFHVTVVESRQDVLDQVQGADRKVNMNYAQFVEEEKLMEDSYLIVSTPSHKYDYDVIHKVFEHKLKPKYIGMLCSKEKLKKFLEKTYEDFGEDLDLSNFYSPIGLDIGGDSPAEIAISIAAEMLAVFYNKKHHNHMKDFNKN